MVSTEQRLFGRISLIIIHAFIILALRRLANHGHLNRNSDYSLQFPQKLRFKKISLFEKLLDHYIYSGLLTTAGINVAEPNT